MLKDHPASSETISETISSDQAKLKLDIHEPVAIIDDSVDDDEFKEGGTEGVAIIIASFIHHFFCIGLSYTFGVYSLHYKEMNLDNTANIQFIGAVGTASVVATGFLSGKLAERFGVKIMLCVSTILMSSALVLASFCTQTWQYALTQGFLFGVGGSIGYFPSLSAIGQWWNKKRSVATGIAASGAGIGGLIMSLVTQKLLSTIGLQWTLRTNAIILATCMIATLPLVKQRIPTRGVPTDWTILRNRRFLLLLGTVFFAMFPNFIPSYFLPSFARDVANLSASDGALLVALYNGSSAFGRILVGFLADFLVGRINSFILCTFLSAISMLVLWPFATTFPLLIFFAMFNGMVSGGYFVLIPVIVGQLFGVAQMASLVGMSMNLSFIGYLAGPPIAGALRESIGFTGVCLFAGGLTLISVFFCIAGHRGSHEIKYPGTHFDGTLANSIPNYILRTFKTANREEIKESARNGSDAARSRFKWFQTWSGHNPNHVQILLDDNDLERFVKGTFSPYIVDAYFRLPRIVQRADFARYLMLYEFGGVYTDMDTECFTPIDKWTFQFNASSVSAIIGIEIFGVSDDGLDQFTQWTMAFAPKHPFLEQFLVNLSTKIYETSDDSLKSVDAVVGLTGPMFWSVEWWKFMKSRKIDVSSLQSLHRSYKLVGDVLVLGRIYFRDPAVFSVHHYAGDLKNGWKKQKEPDAPVQASISKSSMVQGVKEVASQNVTIPFRIMRPVGTNSRKKLASQFPEHISAFRSWDNLNPMHLQLLFSDDDLNRFVKGGFSREIQKTYFSLSDIQRRDFGRYLMAYKFGGIVVKNVTLTCSSPFEASPGMDLILFQDGDKFLDTVFAVSPKHPFVLALIRAFVGNEGKMGREADFNQIAALEAGKDNVLIKEL
ncbi:hypothetical protein HDU79_010180 [Rhizoclosmatium sp. JEL0117]|nr:hypothetical protein HDU79_010180 [Rhizoclosmatium sp. JEL0117]